MLDVARVDTSLEAKRRDLMDKIRQGHAVVADLKERRAAIGRKIDEATAGLRRLEEQLAATEAVMKLFDQDGLVLSVGQPGAPARTPAAEAPLRPLTLQAPRPEPFRPGQYLRCLVDGHDMVASRTMPGRNTCRRCRVRRAI